MESLSSTKDTNTTSTRSPRDAWANERVEKEQRHQQEIQRELERRGFTVDHLISNEGQPQLLAFETQLHYAVEITNPKPEMDSTAQYEGDARMQRLIEQQNQARLEEWQKRVDARASQLLSDPSQQPTPQESSAMLVATNFRNKGERYRVQGAPTDPEAKREVEILTAEIKVTAEARKKLTEVNKQRE